MNKHSILVVEDEALLAANIVHTLTGLGLALSREILDITGITIRETGEPGKGARFEIVIPRGMWRSAGRDT